MIATGRRSACSRAIDTQCRPTVSHDDGTRLDDGELFGGDRLACRAEHFGVLQGDIRDHLNRRTEDVRRIVPPAEPGLDDGHVDAGCRKFGQGRSGEDLELRRLDTLGFGADAFDRRFEVSLFPAHADPLAPTAHVWRHVCADR